MALNTNTLDFLQTQTVSSLVQEEILRMIKMGEIAGGAKLTETTLTDRLGVSRAPLREAFRALEEAGLLKLEKNRGVFVREISGQEAFELYDLRATLDEAAGRQLAPKISDTHIDELHDWLERLETAANQNDIGAYFPLNIGFHDRIVEMTGNSTLIEVYRRLVTRMHLIRRRSMLRVDGSDASRREHKAIVLALESRNATIAGATLRAHVENGYQRFLNISAADLTVSQD